MVNSETYPQNPTIRAISASRRRRILNLLLDRDSPISEQDLTLRLAATEKGASGTDGTTAKNQTLRINLVHNHLPALEAAGLIDWNRAHETTETTTHPALDDPRFRRLLRTETEGLDAVLSGLAHDHRRIILTVLKEAQVPITRTGLAREILRRERELTERDPPSVDDVMASLYHVHLPTLADMDLVKYDSDTGRATYTGHPVLENVFMTIYEPDGAIADNLDEFFGVLYDSYRQASQEGNDQFDWPHFWRKPYHG